MEHNGVDGATPLDEDEIDGLIPDIATQGELNEWEHANIVRAMRWAEKQRPESVRSVNFAIDLHREMFGQTWSWAGHYRNSEKSIGIRPAQIRPALKDLMDDVNYRVEHRTYEFDELCARFHHRLVQIHPFPNGNGRHARLMTDTLLEKLDRPKFSWGGSSLRRDDVTRRAYIAALRAADSGDLQPLLAFIRS